MPRLPNITGTPMPFIQGLNSVHHKYCSDYRWLHCRDLFKYSHACMSVYSLVGIKSKYLLECVVFLFYFSFGGGEGGG